MTRDLLKAPEGFKRCPFCGCKARFWLLTNSSGVFGVIGCNAATCHVKPRVQGGSSVHTKTLARRWNKRRGGGE